VNSTKPDSLFAALHLNTVVQEKRQTNARFMDGALKTGVH